MSSFGNFPFYILDQRRKEKQQTGREFVKRWIFSRVVCGGHRHIKSSLYVNVSSSHLQKGSSEQCEKISGWKHAAAGFIKCITSLQKATLTWSHYYDVMAFSHQCSCKTRNKQRLHQFLHLLHLWSDSLTPRHDLPTPDRQRANISTTFTAKWNRHGTAGDDFFSIVNEKLK